ncbi:monovalent cation/H(+) antiporter subunit G [Auraticoccus monumenti]|uniref:Multisubunit sodium/proton antiporter, MrpG subunit n=1 Tax=Auraticoccus monumenti TaxID=675864 RepID=A0A1G6VG57_9ACTN|nr:monovalent cation/H(+) antiporter subunit G [Auraticoccus monumenti]SDD52559.1 multisubunit sodium/proton antiporter, MrpG subunit [Auraticoccus monumenti]
MVEQVLDVAGLVCLVLGSLLCLLAAVGLLRFPDLLTRMHAGTKPQVLGLLLVLLGVGLRLRTGIDMGMIVLIGLFQLFTVPVAAQMVARAAHRTGQDVGDGLPVRGQGGRPEDDDAPAVLPAEETPSDETDRPGGDLR